MVRIEQLIINIPPKAHLCNCHKHDGFDGVEGVKITMDKKSEPSLFELLQGVLMSFVLERQAKKTATTEEPAAATDETEP